jgi:hypothetical protein
MGNHRDFDSAGTLVPVSTILQCQTAAGFEGGGLWMRPADHAASDDGGELFTKGTDGRVLVELSAGDLLLLEGAWHQPRDIDGGERLIIVCFFHEEAKPAPQPAQPEPEEPELASSRQQSHRERLAKRLQQRRQERMQQASDVGTRGDATAGVAASNASLMEAAGQHFCRACRGRLARVGGGVGDCGIAAHLHGPHLSGQTQGAQTATLRSHRCRSTRMA